MCGCVFVCVRWLARLWNAVVVPRVEEAIISRVTAKRSSSSTTTTTTTSSSSSSLPSSQRLSPSNCGLSAGQQAVVKAALSILVNKAVLLGFPLPRHGVWVPQMTKPSSQSGTTLIDLIEKRKMFDFLIFFLPLRNQQVPPGVPGWEPPPVSHRLL